ncbi:MAG: lamin tail domain-containing protein, partial [Verrucomicrobiales bacterium]
MRRFLIALAATLFSSSLLAQDGGLQILSIEREPTQVILTFQDAEGADGHALEYSADLEGGSWTPRTAEITALGAGQFQASTETAPELIGFFRIQGPPVSNNGTVKVIISEVMTNNENALADGAGDYPDWIEFQNTGENVANLSGYGLTDNESRLGKWLFPNNTLLEPGAFLVVFASGKEDDEIPAGETHASFSLGNGTEPVILTTPEGQVVDRLDPGPLAGDESIGRSPTDADTLYEYEPKRTSPGKTNTAFLFGAPDPFIQVPRFTVAGGVYEDTVTVTIVPALEGDVIRYTTNGAEPFHSLFVSNSTLYTEPIVIDQTTVIRAKVIGRYNSRTITTTYLVGADHELPILSMATEPEHFDFRDGFLYGMGSAISANGSVSGSFPYSSSNAWKTDREIEASIEMFEPDGDQGFATNVGVKIFGGWGSRGYAQKSMAIFARQEYGFGKIRHQLFPDKDIDSFESFVLRNSGNDNQ